MRPILPALLVVCAAHGASLAAQTEHHTISGDRISIYNLAGTLRVQAGSGAQVGVDITRRGRDAAQLKIATGDVRGYNSLRVVYPADRIVYPEMRSRGRTQLRVNEDGTFDDNEGGWFNRRDQVEITAYGSGLEAYADMTLSVPRGQRLVVHWGVGQATVSNVDGDIRVSVAAASVTSEHTRGRLGLDTGSGSVSVTDAQGDVTLDTGSGGVTLNGVRGESLMMDTGSGSISGGDVDVRTLKADVGSGGLRLDRVKAHLVNVDAGSGGVDLQLDTVVDDLSVETGSGGVSLRVPAAQGGIVDIDTGSGGIQTDFPVSMTRFQRNHINGRIGEGSARIRIEAGSGTVRLLKR
jgi:hypothetical protein